MYVPNFLYWCARIVYVFVAAFWLRYISFQMWFMPFIYLVLNLWSFFAISNQIYLIFENVAALSIQIAIII